MSNVNRRIANVCATLSLAALVFAPSALAASKPTAVTGPNTPFPEGRVRLMGWVGPEESSVTACKFQYGPAENDYTSEAPCANHPGDEVQSLEIAAIGGTFQLSFEGAETSDLPYNAGAAEVQAALEALPAIGPSGVSVERPVALSDYFLYLISFQGPRADTDVVELQAKSGSPQLEVDSGSGQTSADAAVVETLIDGGLQEPHEVTAQLDGLTPGATYHYRLVATNAQGSTESDDAVFRAASEPPAQECPNQGSPGVGFLPECRAWEMVSPPAKNGGDVMASREQTRIAADGSAATFASPSPFGDASGAGGDSEYESIRSAAGWQTHAIVPPQPPTTYLALANGFEPRYEGDFSADLGTGVFFAWRPLDQSDPNVEEAANLYLRTNLRSAGQGAYTLLSRCPLCAEQHTKLSGLGPGQDPIVIAHSSDFKHVVFESPLNLVKPAASSSEKLYESEEGTVRLVGILPGGAAATESRSAGPHGANAGRYFPNIAHTVSSDGSKVFFHSAGNLYMRLQGGRPDAETVQLNESELSPPEGNGAAEFRDATPDGSKVFFVDEKRLSEDAPSGGGLYLYDTTKPASDHHNLTYVAAAKSDWNFAEGSSIMATDVIGASASGDTVYFLAGSSSQLQAGTPAGRQEKLYVWHDGRIRYLGSLFEGGGIFAPYRVSPAGQLLIHALLAPLGLSGQFPGYCPDAGNRGDATQNTCPQFYTYDPTTEALQCATCPPPATPAQGITSGVRVEGPEVGTGNPIRRLNYPFSADGRHLFFSTEMALVPEDTNGTFDAYTFDTATSRVSLLSRGTSPYPSYFLEGDPSGSDALFTTRQPLSGWDVDSNADLYDARVEGGLPEPPPLSERCHGEGCPLPPVPPPAPQPNGSGHLEGPGNRKQTHCPHGTHPVTRHGHTRCIKPKHHKKKRRHGKRGGRR